MRVVLAVAAQELLGFKRRNASEFRSGCVTGRYKVKGCALVKWLEQNALLPTAVPQYCQSLMDDGYLIKESNQDAKTFENTTEWYILNDMQQKTQQIYPKPLFKAELSGTAFSFLDINSR